MDPVVEMSRQPESAKVLHHHGQQVLCGQRVGEGRQAVDKGKKCQWGLDLLQLIVLLPSRHRLVDVR